MLQDIYESEAATNQRNRAIGALMYAYGIIASDHAQATDLYTRQCSVGVNARDLAAMAADGHHAHLQRPGRESVLLYARPHHGERPLTLPTETAGLAVSPALASPPRISDSL